MTSLMVEYSGGCFNCMTAWQINGSADRIMIGAQTLGGKVLFKLFINGKRVTGNPAALTVKLTPLESRVFQLIAKTGYERKRKIFEDFLGGRETKRKLLRKLDALLSIELLNQKLRQ